MPQKYVPVEGVATHLNHRGPTTLPELAPDTSRGEVILCLHDAGANGAHFDPLLDALADEHSPIAFDWPGHARSGSLDSLADVGVMADFALNLVRKLGLRPMVWLGEGMGATVALEAARRAPDGVRALVLCAPLAPGDVTEQAVASLDRVASGKARREFDASGFAEGTPRETFARAFGEWVKTDPRVTLGDLKALHHWYAGEVSVDVDAPCLIVSGAARETAGADALAGRIATAHRAVLPSAGRHPVMEQPVALAAEVESFLRGLGDGARR